HLPAVKGGVAVLPAASSGRRVVWPVASVKVLGCVLSVGIAFAGLWSYVGQAQYIQRYQMYDALFTGLLPYTSSPAAALHDLGLSRGLAPYTGYGAGTARSAFAKPWIDGVLFAHITEAKLVDYYTGHPAVLDRVVGAAARKALFLRPALGNLPAANSPPDAKFLPNSPWTVVHRSVLPHRLWFIALVLAAGIAVALIVLVAEPRRRRRLRGRTDGRGLRRGLRGRTDGRGPRTEAHGRRLTYGPERPRPRTSPEVLLATPIIAALALVQFPVGAGVVQEPIKHLVTFNALFDVTLIGVIGAATAAAIAAFEARRAAAPARSTPEADPGSGRELPTEEARVVGAP
ncbi:MAG: hypothetical protein ACRD0B_11915, partial [Acidimicrobiales bacterium]